MRVICRGGERDGWEGTILHGRKLVFPVSRAEYDITDETDDTGRRVAVPVAISTDN